MTAPVPVLEDEQPLDATVPTPALPDRADAPVSEVAERFLKTVVAEVPLAMIEELHLFSPLRQGTVETGIAVLAAKVPVPVHPPAAAETVAGAEDTAPELPLADEGHGNGAEPADLDAGATAPAPMASTELSETTVTTELSESTVIAAAGDDDEEVAVANADTIAVVAEASSDEGDEADALEVLPSVPAPRPVRHTVYTARYRYVIKGPERGKWESSIKAEADAPLITVETVVRGVQRRAGEDSEIVRYTAAQLAKALRLPLTE